MPSELTGSGSGHSEPVYARAAILNEEGGRPTLNPELLVDAFRRFKRGDGEMDLILVASDATLALLLSLPPGLVLAGVVAENQMRDTGSEPRLPVISGVAEARTLIAEGDLVILDPEQGRVLVDPDAEDLARLQADRVRPRLHIDAPHNSARTMAGRRIDVWATVADEEDLAEAIRSGADGILIDSDSGFLPDNDAADAGSAAQRLVQVADRIGGGDMGIVTGPDRIDPDDVFEAASRCRLRWIVRPETLFLTPADFRGEIERSHTEFTAQLTGLRRADQTPLPLITALVQTPEALEQDLAAFDELFVIPRIAETWGLQDTFDLPPLRIIVGDDRAALEHATTLTTIGVVVNPSLVGETKDFIRSQEY